ncbi:hypothetical protein [Undibacterium flavidum]|uniref:PH (Pleckstrin Homology) domain-containing protein n=1 Tax=Undibacterium flavidum TaxID=2762297 RepID=A0ABR6YAZ8_9BURK|nr:hypothetical protein [Undibacterium flavidum]MBC3873752.1 hypothetical protein [Undibacterium flavidum]
MNTKQSQTVVLYRSRQWLVVLWILLPLSTLGVALFGVDAPPDQKAAMMFKVLILMSLINLIALSMFAHLTIELDARALRWNFGLLAWPKWELDIAKIHHVEVCQTRWYEGKGIRLTREGMLYNAAGSGAVRIYKLDGSKIRLGSAEPEILCEKLNALLNK